MILLTVLDGWGLCRDTFGNALANASLPNFKRLQRDYPATMLRASGEAVGLPEGQMGNSEVGHLNIGAGRVVDQDVTRISRAIRDGSFFSITPFREAMANAAGNHALHLMGLLSDGGVHSLQRHLEALLEMAVDCGVREIYLHAFLDGRDVPPQSAIAYLERLEEKCRELGAGTIATVMGRYYAMDRDKRWDRVEKAFRAMVRGEGARAESAAAAVKNSYGQGKTDEFVIPTVITGQAGRPKGIVQSGDSVIFFNFRADRAREITRAFVDADFSGFERGDFPQVFFVCMTQYDATIHAAAAFPPQKLDNTLGQVLARHGVSQLRIAETEKYAHVTFFFNGGIEEANVAEERILVPSPKVATYDLQPEMSAGEVTDKVLEAISGGKYQVIILNYANPDMVGHTGDMAATIKAVQFVDQCLGRIYHAVQKRQLSWLLTADHGNAEKMLEDDGKPHTAHTCNPVPLIFIDESRRQMQLRDNGALADIAPTILDLLRIDKPQEMTGQSLIVKQ